MAVLEGGLVVGIIVAVIIIPLLIYTYLIFPNIDGVVQDASLGGVSVASRK